MNASGSVLNHSGANFITTLCVCTRSSSNVDPPLFQFFMSRLCFPKSSNWNVCFWPYCDAARATINALTIEDEWFSGVKIGTIPGLDPETAQYGQGVGMMVNGQPRGDDVYKHYHMDKITAIAEATAQRTVDVLANHSSQGALGLIRFSAQTLLNYTAQANSPALVVPYLERTGCLKLRTEGDNKSTLGGIRLTLKTSWGGLGFRSLAGMAEAAYVGGFLMAVPRMNRRRTTTNSIDRTGFWPFPDLPNNTIPGSCEILLPFLNSSINNNLQFHTNTTGKVKRDRFKFCFAPDNLHNCPSLDLCRLRRLPHPPG
ncbi:hypothetical protein TrRE_jg3268 [Triparma retinervis]|uniref:Uncharacterized protein n=1 Tax=Triparma retinervis TaxID=2557542 RepID=A0A9W6ZXF6_9STRA|nr:hypothetical protein TrRE_jg3268 [Triparma retinervis]